MSAILLYSYDAANRLTREVNKGVARDFTYSAAGQLKADGTSTYNYDAAGNRAGGDFVSASGNQMVSDGVFTYTYDAVGNLTHKEGLSGGGYIGEEWDYEYDNLNRMISADRYLDTAHTMHAEYKYDWNGNRTEKHVTTYAGVTITSDTLTTMAYDGDDVWGEFQGGSLTTRYLRGDGVDQLLAQVSGIGTANWLLTDHLGSVRDVTDNSHTVATVGTLVYDGWGNATPSGTVGRYQWTGREKDVETGLQYNRARYYDPLQGRWTSQDPLGFDAGDSNLYRYVNNQPTMATDPSGLQMQGGNGGFGGQAPSYPGQGSAVQALPAVGTVGGNGGFGGAGAGSVAPGIPSIPGGAKAPANDYEIEIPGSIQAILKKLDGFQASFDPQNIPGERIRGMIRDTLAQSFKSDRLVYISDEIAPGKRANMVLSGKWHQGTLQRELREQPPPLGPVSKESKLPPYDYYQVVSYDVNNHSPFTKSPTAEQYVDRVIDLETKQAQPSALTEMALSLIPLYSGIKAAIAGDWGEAALSFAADGAMLVSFGASKLAHAGRIGLGALKVAKYGNIAVEGAVALIRFGQAGLDFSEEKSGKGWSHLGEGLLRLFGITSALVTELKVLSRAKQLSNTAAHFASQGRIELANRLRQGQPFTEAQILAAFRQSQHTQSSRQILEALESGQIRLTLDPNLTKAGEALSGSAIRLRPDMTMHDTLGILVQEGQHALDIAQRSVPMPHPGMSAYDRLLAEGLGWSAELQYLQLNGFAQSQTTMVSHTLPQTLLQTIGPPYIGQASFDQLTDAQLRSIMGQMFSYGPLR